MAKDTIPKSFPQEKISLLEGLIQDLLIEDLVKELRRKKEDLASVKSQLEKIKKTLFIIDGK